MGRSITSEPLRSTVSVGVLPGDELKMRSWRSVIDVMRTHPVVIIGGILQQNPFYVEPDDFLREVRERRKRHSGSSLPAA